MKNLLNKYGGYFYAGLCLCLGLIGFGTILIAESLIECVLCVVSGILGLTLCSYAILEQHNKNKESLISINNDLICNDITKDDYANLRKFKSNAQYVIMNSNTKNDNYN